MRGGVHPPPEAFGTAPKSFCTPANYIYFDLIVSYLIILTTKFVKLPTSWSQISPCRPRKQILLNFFLGLSGRCHPAKASSSTPPPPDIYPPPKRKYENPSLHWVVPEKIHTPPTEEISAVRRGRGEKIVSDNGKCIRG